MVNSFGRPFIPENEDERLASLEYYNFDHEPEAYFNSLVEIMAKTLNMPIAIISIVEYDSVYCKACNIEPPVRSTERGYSLCSLAILGSDPLVYQNIMDEPFLHENPFVTSDFNLRFYAGAPIVTPEGTRLGTACVMDSIPRSFNPVDVDLLSKFAKSAMRYLQKRRKIAEAKTGL